MKIKEISDILEASIYCCEHIAEGEIKTACGCDMMSDVLAFVKDQGVLITGLVNPQVVRTALMMDMKCIVFVRGKKPDEKIIDLAREHEIALLCSDYTMFEACGLLYERGMRGGGKV